MSGVKRKATSSLYDDVREKMNTEGDAQMKEYLETEDEKVRNLCDSIAKKYKKTGETENPRELLISFAFMSVRSELNDKQQLELIASNELLSKQLELIASIELLSKQVKQKDEQLLNLSKQLLNSSVRRYGQLKDGDIILDLTGLPSSHTDTGYPPAGYVIKSDMFTQRDPSTIFKTMGETVARGITSCLFARKNLDKDGKLILLYNNEAMVQKIVCNILDDAVKTCNELSKQVWGEKKKSSGGCHDLPLEFQLASQPESSMFQETPDHHVVVYETRSRAPLVTVEVKKPVPNNIINYEQVRGHQGFDYLMATKMCGNICPMHITTTVDESYIAWLPENDETVKEFNQKSKENVRGVLSKIIDKTGRQIGLHDFTQSPLKEEECKIDLSDIEFIEDEFIREMFTSSIFKAHDLFIMMVNTILCSMYCSSFRNCVPRLDAGDIFFQTALKLNSTTKP